MIWIPFLGAYTNNQLRTGSLNTLFSNSHLQKLCATFAYDVLKSLVLQIASQSWIYNKWQHQLPIHSRSPLADGLSPPLLLLA
jgi:hypothetical protein